MDHVLAGGPLKHREAPVLGCHERNGIPLILDELGRRQVPRATELLRVHSEWSVIFHWIRQRDLFDPRRTLPVGDLRPKPQKLIPVN